MIDRLISRKEATKVTGLSLSQLNALCRQGLIRIVKINQRVFRIPESDLENLPGRIEEHNAMVAMSAVDSRSGLTLEVAEGLREIYGYVPGGRS
jgi:predicted site-specific integrase-resolvase